MIRWVVAGPTGSRRCGVEGRLLFPVELLAIARFVVSAELFVDGGRFGFSRFCELADNRLIADFEMTFGFEHGVDLVQSLWGIVIRA